MTTEPTAELDGRFSSEDAKATPWADVVKLLQESEVFWLSTVRADGRPHVTTLLAGWIDDELHFVTGDGEQKMRNLDGNPHCVLTTGTSDVGSGIDVVVEGRAARVTDEGRLAKFVELWALKYEWPWKVVDGGVADPDADGSEPARVFAVAPVKVFAFAKGDSFGQTRFRPSPTT